MFGFLKGMDVEKKKVKVYKIYMGGYYKEDKWWHRKRAFDHNSSDDLKDELVDFWLGKKEEEQPTQMYIWTIWENGARKIEEYIFVWELGHRVCKRRVKRGYLYKLV